MPKWIATNGVKMQKKNARRRSWEAVRSVPADIVFFVLFCCASRVWAEEKVTYQDNILPLIETHCSKCHNSDKRKADLDLTSYQGALKGSGSGEVVLSGNVDGSKLWKALTHAEEPYMPPNRPRLDEKDLALFRKWIGGGL